MARADNGTNVPISPARVFLRIWVLLTVLFLTLKGQDFAPVRRRKNQRNPLTVTALHTKRGWD